MEYTTDSKNIYFLNDKNIASGTEITCQAGFNAIPSQTVFAEKYKELTAYDNAISGIVSGEVKPGLEKLSDLVNDISTATSSEYVKKSGDTISKLSVESDLTIGGNISAQYFQTNTFGNTVFTGPNKSGSIKFDLSNGADAIAIGDNMTLGSFVTGKIDELSCGAQPTKQMKTITSLKQENGKISYEFRNITSDDIPVIPESKVENLTSNYATKAEITNAKYVKTDKLAIEYSKDQKLIRLIDSEHNISSGINCDDFIKDGMLSTVETKAGDAGEHPVSDGPYLVMTWNTDAGGKQTWIKIKDLTYAYTSTDPGLSIVDYKIKLNYDVVARESDVSPIKTYVNELSSSGGIIQQLSTHLSSLDYQNIRQVKFDGHIKYVQAGWSLSSVLKEAGGCEGDAVNNNSMYDICFAGDLSALSASYTTSDGFKLGNRDIIVIHECGSTQAKVPLANISHENVKIMHAGVSRYEFEDEISTRKSGDGFLSGKIDDLYAGTAKLSGNNVISNENTFLSKVTFGTNSYISAGADNLTISSAGNAIRFATGSQTSDLKCDGTEVATKMTALPTGAEAYNAASSYNPQNLCWNDNKLWMALSSVSAIQPSESANWTELKGPPNMLSNALRGQTFDFGSGNNLISALFTALSAVIGCLGGNVKNFPTFE